MKEYATLSARFDQLEYGSAEYSRPYPHSGPQCTNLNDMLKQGWQVTAKSIEPGHLASHGYRAAQALFILEREITEQEPPGARDE
jgi:hypothetical protein